ncbi:MAG: hypothetical protein ACK2U3_01250 [Anaerolineales bacterium]
MNRITRWIDLTYVIGLLLLPFLIMGGLLLTGFIQGLTRYNQDYFNEHYQNLYAVPNSLVADLENALREGNVNLLAETQGTRTAKINNGGNPNLRFMIMLESSGQYLDYLFMDTSNYQRFPQHIKQLNGRYIRVPEGLYYAVDSRGWTATFFPLAAIWWLLVILFTVSIWFFRIMKAYRQKRFGEISSNQH